MDVGSSAYREGIAAADAGDRAHLNQIIDRMMEEADPRTRLARIAAERAAGAEPPSLVLSFRQRELIELEVRDGLLEADRLMATLERFVCPAGPPSSPLKYRQGKTEEEMWADLEQLGRIVQALRRAVELWSTSR